MKPLLFILISLAWLTVSSTKAQGCSCLEYDVPVCAAYSRADAVFTGQLLDITVEKESDQQISTAMLHFIVEQPFRGITGDRVEVETIHGTSCDLRFAKGEKYLIYAGKRSNGQLVVGPCTRTQNLKYADEDLSYLRTLAQQEVKETILGRFGKFQQLPGLRITVQNADQTIETKTDQNGNFSVLLPGPGNYKVSVFIPFAAAVMAYPEDKQATINASTLTIFEYEAQVARNECHFRQLEAVKRNLDSTAEVSGSVVTGSGRPVSRGWVYLVNAAYPADSELKKIETNGSFKFESVPVGDYYLVLNPHNAPPDESDAPYPRTYYPHAADASTAAKIVVTEGVKLENLTLRVGPSWKGRDVTGKVVWPDGSPAQGARISLYDNNDSLDGSSSTKTGDSTSKSTAISNMPFPPRLGGRIQESLNDYRSTRSRRA